MDPVCMYIDGSGECPACGASFFSRVKVLAHAAERRFRRRLKPRCRDVILSGAFPPVDASLLAELEASDRKERREARQAGRTHVRVDRPAKRANPSTRDENFSKRVRTQIVP
eukprot:1761242-Karenia_brevis.AAC.1